MYNQQVFGTLCVFSEKEEGGWRAKVTVYDLEVERKKVREVRCYSFHSLPTAQSR